MATGGGGAAGGRAVAARAVAAVAARVAAAAVGAAVLCAAYCASDSAANDKDDDDDDGGHPPCRAVPRGLLRDATTVLQLPFLARNGDSSGAVAIRGSELPVWRIGRSVSAITAFIQQIDVVALLSNGKGSVSERYGVGIRREGGAWKG